jgi:hypothetical protein
VRKRLVWKEKLDLVDRKVKTNLYVLKVKDAFNAMRYKDSDKE